MEKPRHLRDIRHVGRRRRDAVHQPRDCVHPDVRLHPEVPLIPLLDLMHRGVARLGAVLRRRRRVEDGRVHDRAFPQPQALRRQMPSDLGQQHLAQGMAFQQVPEVQDGRLIGARAPCGEAHEALHGHAVVERVFHGRVAEVVEQLHAVNPQHHG